VLGLTAGPFFLHAMLTFRRLTPQQVNADPALVFSQILPMYGLFFLFFFLVVFIDAILEDFLLPPMAVEDAPVEHSTGRLFHLLRYRFGSVLAYLLLRFALQLGLSMAGGMIVFVILAILGLGGMGLGLVMYHAFFHAGVAGLTIFIAYCVVAGLIVFSVYFLAVIFLHGIVALFRQSFALYFYGSHYPQLGNYIDPEPPPPAAQPVPSVAPPFPLPEPPAI
jgi:hypothetical protein